MFFIGETYISVSVALVINVTTPRVRALRKGYIETGVMLCLSFLGGSFSSLALGAVGTSQSELRVGMLAIVPTGYFLAGVLFFAVSRTYPGDLEQEKAALLAEK